MFSNHDLAALLAVADTGSMRGASNALHRTQPAITQAIRRLEESAGLQLVDRSSYRARLTTHGERFAGGARAILAEMKRLKDLSALLASGIEPRIRMALDCAIPDGVWLPLLREFAVSFTQTEIEMEAGEGRSIAPRLAAGELDLAIMFDLSADALSQDLERTPIGDVGFCNAIRADALHHLMPEGASLPQIVVVDFEGGLTEYGLLEGQHCWRVANHEIQVALIRDGLGWGSVPQALVDDDIGRGKLVTAAYQDIRERSAYSISLYRCKNGVTGPAKQMLWAAAAVAFGKR